MKIVAFTGEKGSRLGVVEGDQAIDLSAADGNAPTDLGEWLAAHNGDLKPLADLAKRAPASAHRPLSSLTYGLPVVRPGKIICLGLNYLEHVKEGAQRDNVPKFPTIFMRGRTSLVPHGQPIVRPLVTETLDYEAEMILVVGERAKHLTAANALSCVAGYSCGNEGSVREFQRKTTQWDMGKNFDHTGGFGPWFVSADELPPGGRNRLGSRALPTPDGVPVKMMSPGSKGQIAESRAISSGTLKIRSWVRPGWRTSSPSRQPSSRSSG